MRVIVVGGAGEVGSPLSSDLAGCPEVDELVIADRDLRAAEALRDRIGEPRVTAATIDVDDRVQAGAVLRGADLLMNCTPFAHFDKVINLACEHRLQYADLISEPTSEHRERARDAGVTAISGLGLTPGLSNVLARHAHEEFDRLEEVQISWVSLRTIAPTRGGLGTILWELGEDCPARGYYESGRFEPAGAFDGGRMVKFPEPVSTQRVYYVPHPEVQTLPVNLPDLRSCSVRGTWRPELMADIAVLNRCGLLAAAAADTTAEAIWSRFGGQRDDRNWPLFLKVEAVGLRDGELVRRIYDATHPIEWAQEGMARTTGTCAAVGVQLLARHGTSEPGFVDPEVYYDPDEFLAELRKRDSVTVESREEKLNAAGEALI